MRKEIKKISLASLFSALSAALIILGGTMDMLDLTVAAVGSMLVYISMIEIKGKYPFLIYITTSVLSFIFVPMTTSALYYVAFFGYFPIIRYRIKKLGKVISKIICIGIFNVSMILLFLLFKAVFAMQNEPMYMYVILLVTSNIFYLCFDYALDVFAFIYITKIRKKLNLK